MGAGLLGSPEDGLTISELRHNDNIGRVMVYGATPDGELSHGGGQARETNASPIASTAYSSNLQCTISVTEGIKPPTPGVPDFGPAGEVTPVGAESLESCSRRRRNGG